MKEWLESKKWIFAKTYAHFAPHYYIVKTNLHPNEYPQFEKVVEEIEAKGFLEEFGKKLFRCLFIGDYKYWTMGAGVKKTTVLNRKPKKEMEIIQKNLEGEDIWKEK